MKLMLKIAWRNILRHKGKSLVIGVILFLGAFLMTIGNGVISGMDAGIKSNIVNAFLGDIVIISDKQKTDNVLFSFMGTAVEPVNTYKQIKEVLLKQDGIDRFMPMGKNLAMTLRNDDNTPGFVYLIGIDVNAYQKMFPDNLSPLEGRLLKPGEKGIMVPTFAREEYYKMSNIWLVPEGGSLIKANVNKELLKDFENVVVDSSIVLMGMNETNSSTDIRYNVKGIARYHALNTIFGHFCITDIESYRECLGYFSAAENAVEVPKEEQRLLASEGTDLDSLFSDSALMVSNERNTAVKRVSSNAVKKPADVEDGTYNLVLVKLKDGVSRSAVLENLNRALKDAGTGTRAISWNKAAGPIGSMTTIIKSALFLFVTFLFIVAIIIIINTLTMAALERTAELGMMRAIGARKGFIGGMFLGETGILSFLFGGAGIICGIVVVNIIPLLKITSANDMVQLLYGGDVFHPLLRVPDIALTVLQLLIVTVLAALYPIKVARNITPLDAISRD